MLNGGAQAQALCWATSILPAGGLTPNGLEETMMNTLLSTAPPMDPRASYTDISFTGLRSQYVPSQTVLRRHQAKKQWSRPCGSWSSSAMDASITKRETVVASSLKKTSVETGVSGAKHLVKGNHARAMEWNDETLNQALDGNRPAMRELVKHLTPVIQARVAKCLMVGSRNFGHDRVREEVADMTQEVFAALFANDARVLRNWEPTKGLSLRNFAGLVAHRQALSILRTTKRNPFTEDPTLDTDFEFMTEQDETLESATISRDLIRQVFHRMDEQLSPLGRQLFNMVIIQELDVSDVATQTGMSDSAIYAWRSRLAKHLKREYQSVLSETSSSEQRS
ncbi:MAG: sigma-70 family RNA polymerase sigma factor [Deltaproteobacteria bacterium]|jgi:RNA polymerase sigma factor (sigma-70 family)|nr:sigma-70 family RNA polymerase sigma factor [Deltaproteobacteria bacterium]